MICIGLLAALSLMEAASPLTVDDELRRARNEYTYGNYDRSVDILRGLLYPMRLYSDEQVLEARQVLGLSYYLLGREDQMREEFTKLLYLEPDFELDPFTVAPAVIEKLESLRKELRPELDVIRQRKNARRLEQPQREGYRRVVEITITEKSDIATFLPFGVGQFHNGDMGWGFVFALSEILLLSVNIGAHLWLRSLRVDGRPGYTPDQRKLVQGLTVAEFASVGLLGFVWSIGVFHARLNFVPRVEQTTVTDEPTEVSGLAPLPVETPGLLLTLSF